MRSPQQTAPDLHPTNPDPRLAEIRARKADRRAIRAEFAARRQRGLEYRHAQRLHNLAVARQQATERGEPPPTNLTSHRTPNSLTTTQPPHQHSTSPSTDAVRTVDPESDAERARPSPAQVADCAASAGGRASSGHAGPDSEQVPTRLGRDVGRAQPAVRPSPIRPSPIRQGSAGPMVNAVSATDHESAAEQARPPPGQLATCGTSANGQAGSGLHSQNSAQAPMGPGQPVSRGAGRPQSAGRPPIRQHSIGPSADTVPTADHQSAAGAE
jgi:hypothetical protein